MTGSSDRTELNVPALLARLSQPESPGMSEEIIQLLDANGFVSVPLDPSEPQQVLFYIHPQHPHLHMCVPLPGPVLRPVVDHAVWLANALNGGVQ